MPWYVGNREVHLKANIMPIHIPVDFDTPEDVMDVVTANGCNLVQGYYFSKPLPGGGVSAVYCGFQRTWGCAGGNAREMISRELTACWRLSCCPAIYSLRKPSQIYSIVSVGMSFPKKRCNVQRSPGVETA